MHAVVVLLPGVTSAAMLCSLKMVLWFLRGRSAALIMQFCQPTSRVCSDTRRVVTKKMRLLQEDTHEGKQQGNCTFLAAYVGFGFEEILFLMNWCR